jgi:hypothetical protein
MSIAFSCDAQILDSLPPDSILYKNLATYHQSLVTAQLSEFEISAKGNWMNYVPSVGVGYAPSGEPRPTMSFSLSQIFTYQSEIRKLQALLHQFQIIQSDIRFANSIHQIDIQLFQFYETQHRNSEITASQFLLKKRDMLTKEQNIKKIETSLEDKRLEIMEASY